VGKTEAKGQLEKIGINGRMILKWILKKQDWRAWTGLNWLRVRMWGFYEHGNELQVP
jgi:hypothetical protein